MSSESGSRGGGAKSSSSISNVVIWHSLDEGYVWVQSQFPEWKRPVVILLEGPMGAGKTQVTKWIVSVATSASSAGTSGSATAQTPTSSRAQVGAPLDSSSLTSSVVSSPTFGIHNRYDTPSGYIDHVDLYRLDSDSDLESTGFWDLFQTSDFVVVEWSDRLPISVWPASWQKVRLKISSHHSSSDSRSVQYEIF